MRCPCCHRRIVPGTRCPHDGEFAPHAAPPSLPRIPALAGVELGELLGFGGHAVVFAGRLRGQGVAVKLAIGDDEDRLTREAEALARLGPPHAPRLIEGHRHYLILERLHQPSLATMLATSGAASPIELRAIARALFTALAAIADRGLVHGDLSPENLMYDGRAITVIDFGLARALGTRPITEDLGAGTLHYMSPEVLRGSPATSASDVYSAGAVLYELACGLPPFVGDPAAIERAIELLVPPPVPGLPAWSSAVLRKDPAARPTARALLGALDTDDPVRIERPSQARPDAGARPAVVESVALLATSGVALPIVERTIAASRGWIAKQRGPRTIAVFSARDHDAPLDAALHTATTLIQAGARCAVHVAALELTPGTRSRASGSALDTLEVWWPAGTEQLHLTADAAALQQTTDPPLVGRDELLDVISRTVDRSALLQQPTVVTVYGDRGTGKTRLARALVSRLAERVRVIDLAPRSAALGDALAQAGSGALAIVVDDGHLVDPAVLALLDGLVLEDRAVCVVMIADRELLEVHPGWAAGTRDVHEHVLAPLDERSGIALARAVIDQEFCPAELLAHLVQISAGHPRTLVDVARLARARGETTDIRSISTAWLAARVLDQLPHELQRFAGLLAIAGPAVTREELATLGELDAGPRVDVGAALSLLAAAGHARPATGGWELQPAALAHLAASRVHVELARRLHERVRELLEGRHADPAELARHAIAAGDPRSALAHYAALAEDARAAHRTFEAERWAGEVLAIASPVDPLRFEAALLRASMRYRRHRIPEALADLAVVRSSPIPSVVARADLEAGIVLDWAHDFEASWGAAARARSCAEPAISLGVRLAEGRRAFRGQRLDDAVAILSEVIDRAHAFEQAPEHDELSCEVAVRISRETALIAKLLLAPTLAWLGELDRAEPLFEQVIAHCLETGDRLHAAVAFANRSFLWFARQRPDAQRADLERCIELARTLGNPLLERVPAYNLAEILYWAGNDLEARRYQRRTAELAARFVDGDVPDDALLEARIAIANGEYEVAADRLRWIDDHCKVLPPQPMIRLSIAAIRAVLTRATIATWDELTEDIRQLPDDEQAELWFLRALAHPSDSLARTELAGWPHWTARLARQ